MDIIDEINKDIIKLKDEIKELKNQIRLLIIKFNKINNIATYSSSDDSDIKYPDDSDYD